MSTLCVFHRADLDGHCSGAIINHALRGVDLHGYDYIDGAEEVLARAIEYDDVYMVDCSLPTMADMKNLQLATGKRFVWIDHHKGVIREAEAAGFNPAGLRRDGTAGCELTWEFFFSKETIPRAVYLLGRYDVFELEADKDILPFQYGMRAEETRPDAKLWKELFTAGKQRLLHDLLLQGKTIQRYQQKQDDMTAKALAFDTEIDGHPAIASNGGKGSLFFSKVYDPEKHDVMITFHRNGKKKMWSVSLYADKDDVDCEQIAKKFGGGGHLLASGFPCEKLPFEY